MATMVDRVCACGCGRQFKVRLSDVKRGWGRFASKSCKARHQERRTGQYRALCDGDFDTHGHPFASGWDGHGQN